MNGHYVRKRERSWIILLISLTLWSGQAFKTFAIVDAGSQTNTNAPSDGSPWASMGHVSVQPNGNGYSGIYVGAGWVLTAAHVPPGDTDFGGTFYPWDGTSRGITNANGTGTDMQMFHLRTLPPLPRMPLTTTAPAGNAQVDLIAFGYIAGSAQMTIGSYTGFYWSAPNQYKSWGTNRVDLGGTGVINTANGNLTVFTTTFTAPPGQTSDEGQAAPGDSGGGVFEKNGSIWQLVGVIDAISIFPDQASSTAVYGNQTYIGNVATYRAQIVAVIAATRPALSISPSGTNVMVCWPDTGVTYNLYANHSLATMGWTQLNPVLTLTNGQYCALLPHTNSPNFFRLKTP